MKLTFKVRHPSTYHPNTLNQHLLCQADTADTRSFSTGFEAGEVRDRCRAL